MAKRTRQKGPHGGARENAGRRAYFRGKTRPRAQFSIVLTRKGLTALESSRRKIGASRSDFVEALLRAKSTQRTFQQWPNKTSKPLAIQLTSEADAILAEMMAASGISRGNIIETLVQEHASEITRDTIAALA